MARAIRSDRITPVVQRAVDAMVWHNLDYVEAGKTQNLSAFQMRRQLHNPLVQKYKREQEVMLLSSERTRTIQRLVAIRDAANNMPAVTAARVLLDLEAEQRPSTHAGASSAGITIHINGQMDNAVQRQRVIASEGRPIIEHEGPFDVVPDPPPVVSGRKGR